jgi:hypothetical protein
MKTLGTVLATLGIAGIIFFGIQAINDSETLNLFGLDIAISKANWTPLIVSVAVTAIGGFMVSSKKK